MGVASKILEPSTSPPPANNPYENANSTHYISLSSGVLIQVSHLSKPMVSSLVEDHIIIQYISYYILPRNITSQLQCIVCISTSAAGMSAIPVTDE